MTNTLANIMNANRDLSNYKYLCRRCHMSLDIRKDMTDRVCSLCGSNKTTIHNSYQKWQVWHDGFICNSCSWKQWHLRKKIFETLKEVHLNG